MKLKKMFRDVKSELRRYEPDELYDSYVKKWWLSFGDVKRAKRNNERKSLIRYYIRMRKEYFAKAIISLLYEMLPIPY